MSSTIETNSILGFTPASLTQSDEFHRVFGQIERGARVISISGLVAGPARALALAALQLKTGRQFALVVPAQRDLENWERDISFWYCALRGVADCSETVAVVPASESDPYAGGSPHAETLERRALALWRLARGRGDFVLLSSRALARRTVPPSEILNAGAVLRRDEDISPDELVDKLLTSGYVREDPIGAVGEFSIRGGILDVWPPGHDAPVRIEFFGDTVDSLREFDPETQLSITQLAQVEVAPMRELIVRSADFREWSARAKARWHDARFARSLRDRTDFADEGEDFPGWEWLIGLVHERKASIFEYLKDAVLAIDEPVAVENFLIDAFQAVAERYAEADAADDLGLTPAELYLTAEELRSALDAMQRIEVRALGRTAAKIDQEIALDAEHPKISVGKQRPKRQPLFLFPHVSEPGADRDPHAGSPRGVVDATGSSSSSESLDPVAIAPGSDTDIDWKAQSVMRYHGRLPDLARDVRQRRANNRGVTLFVMPSRGVAERVSEILRDYEVNARLSPIDEFNESANAEAMVTFGKLSGGFELPSARLVVHVEADLFDEAAEPALERRATAIKREKKRRARAAAFLSDFRDLRVGDYVVHIDHGIARFGGLVTLDLGPTEPAAATINKPRSEFMLLYYADEAKLYVPVERLDLVQRYSSAEGAQPTLDRLGGLGWQKTKAKAKRAMRDMADELLRLYAERKLVNGHAFPTDSPWQYEFEQGFEYTLTADQETAIDDVKHDMETPTPMDRLLCGDVGYGKTEVAMRAAFKAVMDGKQAAVLTPTTVLAYQHFDTFRQRFAAFPVKVELLSRFRSSKEQKDVVKRVESGEVDVVIGTHRMLSKDVSFKDLGLVVVDEEQRFGVAHKERLKQLKKRVDVLTLSATPIPRTLNMSLSGLRDMSLIETPPSDRLAIQTQVVQSSDAVIKSAIELELARGGQVFFIHNRVESIETIAALVKRLVPQARIAVAHGQMNEKEMEAIMLDFIAYKYDVLVATTIIENGIDIPRANTIIINRADNYGLSQLYQLRGRVGRSNRRAYAYLLIPAEQELTPIARRRLSAIREFSDLGAGFRIAALDLELRGAGNLLGGEQSGHMDALGFDLYTQMLERTVAELRGEQVEDETSVSINLGVDVAIPETYISDMGQRLRTYKRVSSARDEEALSAIRAETEDRYGRIPESVEALFDYARLRQAAELVGVISIDRTREGVAIKLAEKARVAPEKLMELIRLREGANFAPSGVLRLELSEDEKDEVLAVARRVLLQIRADS
ncbi:MAG TPA: transcription-repair coupling factor [Pyrinomonadaceae bacterium]|jgi:transcription-repair coupling factor (superfamily II helicase)|nr:transcription-repair coupling factor [Pyrinomonadaceae bacterium]